MASSYLQRRGQVETYFDRTAADAWARLTSDAPVSRIRATVRAGRDRMRATLLDYLPQDLGGRRILDAGCGTGALAVEAARRGAKVVAVDISPTLVQLARDRLPRQVGAGSVEFHVGDMFDAGLGEFDHVVAMDSLIHYRAEDVVTVLAGFGARTRESLVFTFAPSTFALALMHTAGRVFPRGNRAPSIEPVRQRRLHQLLAAHPQMVAWQPGRSNVVRAGFYISQAQELVRP